MDSRSLLSAKLGIEGVLTEAKGAQEVSYPLELLTVEVVELAVGVEFNHV